MAAWFSREPLTASMRPQTESALWIQHASVIQVWLLAFSRSMRHGARFDQFAPHRRFAGAQTSGEPMIDPVRFSPSNY